MKAPRFRVRVCLCFFRHIHVLFFGLVVHATEQGFTMHVYLSIVYIYMYVYVCVYIYTYIHIISPYIYICLYVLMPWGLAASNGCRGVAGVCL